LHAHVCTGAASTVLRSSMHQHAGAAVQLVVHHTQLSTNLRRVLLLLTAPQSGPDGSVN
jgi:hypothetical protein